MTDQSAPVVQTEDDLSFWDRHRLSLLLIFTVLIALTLTVVSMVVYTNSGSAQLDLSRPGYRSVSDQVESGTAIDEYSAFGPVNEETIQEFLDVYDKQAEKAKAVDAFNGDPLNPELLEFGTVTTE